MQGLAATGDRFSFWIFDHLPGNPAPAIECNLRNEYFHFLTGSGSGTNICISHTVLIPCSIFIVFLST